MAVGNQPNQGNINNTLTENAIALRELANDIIQTQQYNTKLGLAGLQALGFAGPDAQAVLDDSNHMATVAQVYKGTATQAALFNFEDSLTHLWAGA
jgi:hypothetical protein